tara:strand:+ start:6104 stop:7534 length:1431 start_codon:yes stop_codon:yes gene_type:complete
MIKKICCIGAGYVGTPTMAVIALKSPNLEITVVDSNKSRIDAWNSSNSYDFPVKEPGLDDIIKEVRNKNLFFSSDVEKHIDESEMIFLAVNTPTKKEGEGKGFAADLTNIDECAKQIARVSSSNKIIVEKSTLPVRTAERLKEIIKKHKKNDVTFEIISNPEFLAEGTAIRDLFKSDRVLIGCDQTEAGLAAMESLVKIYKNWIPKERIIKTNIWSSELSKLASNAMLAQRISSINSLSALTEKTEAKINELSLAIGKDHRIGDKFLNVSPGFGGSCFKKDILNLVYICRQYGLEEVAEYWHQVVKINDYQRKRIFNIVNSTLVELKNKKISILGWSFKKDTNDTRESSSIPISSDLIINGASLKIYDPLAEKKQIIQDLTTYLESKDLSLKEIKSLLSQVKIQSTLSECLTNTNAIIVLTEWDEFKQVDWQNNKLNTSQINLPYIFDTRNILDIELLKSLGYEVFQIGNGDNTIK